MKHWHTCGAFGENVYELTLWEWFKMLFGWEFKKSSVVVSVGKSKVKCSPHNYAGSREQQLGSMP